jgi:hypothetical protein
LAMAWARVRGNRGGRTAGVDGMTAHYMEDVRGVGPFLTDLRADLKARRFTPLPVRERMTPIRAGNCVGWASRPSGDALPRPLTLSQEPAEDRTEALVRPSSTLVSR